MNVIRTELPEVLLLEPRVFSDERGFFYESYSARRFQDAIGQELHFPQDNHSRSARGVLRGLHFQRAPHAQGKLVRVVHGAVFDVAVDIRRSSDTFGKWVGVELSADNRRQVWIPPGFAHGFLVLSDVADVLYKATEYYAPASEGSIRWDDPQLAIAWPDAGVHPLLSSKDAAAPTLALARLDGDAATPGVSR
jgi:dTDP-4-dehydrorhamnose 3,5-epimerase